MCKIKSSSICFFTEEIDFQLMHPTKVINWLQGVVQKESTKFGHLNFIFCSDNYLHDKNKTYLQHDTFTDVLTFDNSEEKNTIIGDIYISIDRIKENAVTYQQDFWKEVYRVMVHGTLHLLGYQDHDKATRAIMQQKEDLYLALLIVTLK